MSFDLLEYFCPREKVEFELNTDKETFINRFQKKIDYDRGYLSDELYSSKKEYLGKINSKGIVLRIKRKFMTINFSNQVYAKGKFLVKNNKDILEIEIFGNDEFGVIGVLFVYITLIILFISIIVSKAYPALIFFIPILIIFILSFDKIKKCGMRRFKEQLLKNLNNC